MTRRQRKANSRGRADETDGAPGARPSARRQRARPDSRDAPAASTSGVRQGPDTAAAIRLLILESTEEGAENIEKALRDGGAAIKPLHVTTRIAFIRALREFQPDIVITACRLPDFCGLSAVKLVRLQSRSLPVIAVSAPLDGESIAALMKAGANEFVVRDKLAGLAGAVRRALAEGEAIRSGEAARRLGDERVQALMNSASGPVAWAADADGRSTAGFPGWRRFTGQTDVELREAGWWTAIHPEDRKRVKAAWREAVQQGMTLSAACRIRRADGVYRHFAIRAVPVADASGAISEWLGIGFDMTEEKQQELDLAQAQAKALEILRAQAVRDPLTGLFNRHYLQETLPRECRQALRRKTPFTVAMLDIDRFKLFNDLYGHQAGDRVLKELGSLLLTTVRTSDIVCRYGGEEFLVVLLDAELAVALTTLERICHDIKRRQIVFRGRQLPGITLSAGVAQFPVHGTATTDLLRAADQALYAAKHQGRDRLVISSTVPGCARRRG